MKNKVYDMGNGTAGILLANSMHLALVDEVDLEVLKSHKWRSQVRKGQDAYAIASVGKGTIRMHRVIASGMLHPDKSGVMVLVLELKMEELVDHINGWGLDNRRANLRVADHSLNSRNQVHPVAGRKTPYLGIIQRESGGWQAKARLTAHLRSNDYGQGYYAPMVKALGTYDDPESAALAYDLAMVAEYGLAPKVPLNAPRWLYSDRKRVLGLLNNLSGFPEDLKNEVVTAISSGYSQEAAGNANQVPEDLPW